MVTGRAGLAHATRLGPNSPFFNVLLAIYTFLYFLFCIIAYQFSEEPLRTSAQVLQPHKKISVFIENRMI